MFQKLKKPNAEPLYQSAETWNISVSTDSDIKVFMVYKNHTHTLCHTKSLYVHFISHTLYSKQAFAAAAHFKHPTEALILSVHTFFAKSK